MQITNMEEKHVDKLLLLAKSAFSRPWSREAFMEEIHNPASSCLVVEVEQNIVGYCVFQISFETADLAIIMIDEKYRKQGLAQKLLNQQMHVCRNQKVERILLEVRESNTSALSFYVKNNFKQISTRRQYYSNPQEDGLILCKEIC